MVFRKTALRIIAAIAVFVLAGLAPHSAEATISVLQARQNSLGSSTTTTISLAYASNVTAGSYLYVVASVGANVTITCADTLNGSYGTALDSIPLSTGGQMAHFRVLNPTGGANTVVCTFSAAAGFPSIFIAEIAGSSGLDAGGTAHNANYQASTTLTVGNITSGTVTPSVQPGLVIGVSFSANLNSVISADTAAGFTDIVGTGAILGSSTFWQFTTGGNLGDAEFKTYSSLTSVPALFTPTSASTAGTVAALFAQSGGGAGAVLAGTASNAVSATGALTTSGAIFGPILLDDPAHVGGSDNVGMGTGPNTGTGDSAEVAFPKLKQWAADLNSMIAQLYPARSIQAPTTGFSIATAKGITQLILHPAGTLATGTVTLPPGPGDQQPFELMTNQTITGLTCNTSDGSAINGAPTSLSANTAVRFWFVKSLNAWFRAQ